jgi:hypothetical protein
MARLQIQHAVNVIRQPRGSKVCWAAATAMTVGGGESIASVQTKARAGEVRLHDDGSLPIGDLANVRRLATQFRGLSVADVRTTPVTVALMAGWLRRGRFALLGGFNYPGEPTAFDHAVTFFAIQGDGTARGTQIFLADPYNDRFHDDFEHFEESIMADPHFVIHR